MEIERKRVKNTPDGRASLPNAPASFYLINKDGQSPVHDLTNDLRLTVETLHERLTERGFPFCEVVYIEFPKVITQLNPPENRIPDKRFLARPCAIEIAEMVLEYEYRVHIIRDITVTDPNDRSSNWLHRYLYEFRKKHGLIDRIPHICRDCIYRWNCDILEQVSVYAVYGTYYPAVFETCEKRDVNQKKIRCPVCGSDDIRVVIVNRFGREHYYNLECWSRNGCHHWVQSVPFFLSEMDEKAFALVDEIVAACRKNNLVVDIKNHAKSVIDIRRFIKEEFGARGYIFKRFVIDRLTKK